MEEELNYLSEKIEQIENNLLEGETYIQGSPHNIKKWKERIKNLKEEKQLLENILSALTISELNKNKTK